MPYYQVLRKVVGLDEEPGDFIADDKYPNTLALAQTGVLQRIEGEPPVAAPSAPPVAEEKPTAAAAPSVAVDTSSTGRRPQPRRR